MPSVKFVSESATRSSKPSVAKADEYDENHVRVKAAQAVLDLQKNGFAVVEGIIPR